MKKLVCFGLVCALFLCGCGLLPEEEEFRKAPVVETMEEVYFTTDVVKKGTVTDFISGSCKYDYMDYQNLSFDVSTRDNPIEETYVKVGDKVKAGQVLAKLSLGEREEELTQLQESCANYQEDLTYQESLLAFEKERQSLAKKYGRDYDTTNLENLEEQVKVLEEALYVEQIRLDELNAELAGRQLVSAIDGVVMHVEPPSWWGLQPGETYIVVRSEEKAFSSAVEKSDKIQIGDVYTVTTDDNAYECEVIRIRDHSSDRLMMIDMVPLIVDDSLNVDDSYIIHGNVMVITEQAKDVLYIPTAAVRMIDEKTAVYVVDENGMRSIRYVEIGLSVSGNLGENVNLTEIRSGLQLGEEVIIR